MTDDLPDDSTKLQRALNIHDDIVALYRSLKQQRIHRRNPMPVMQELRSTTAGAPVADRDGIICAFASKCANTHAAIRVLVEADLADDALSLCRVLLEATILMEWMMRDRVYRWELYYLSMTLLRRRFATVAKAHYTHDPKIVGQAETLLKDRDAQLAGEVFGDTHHRWARRRSPAGSESISLEQIFKEVATSPGTPIEPTTTSFMNDVVYLRLSQYVHSTVLSLIAIYNEQLPEQFLLIERHASCSNAVEAISTSNIAMLVVISELNEYSDAGLDSRINEIHEAMKGNHKPQDQE